MDDCQERTELYEYCSSHAPVRFTRGGHFATDWGQLVGCPHRRVRVCSFSSRCQRIASLDHLSTRNTPSALSELSTIHNVVSPQICISQVTTELHSTETSIDAQFKVAVEKIGSLPKNGPIKPSQDDQLNVSTFSDRFLTFAKTKVSPRAVLRSVQASQHR